MKPNDLKSPFNWKQRRVAIEDRIWYVPTYYDQYQSFTFPGWANPCIFAQDRPIKVEYCSGNGLWIADRARNEPDINWVGVEKKFERVRRIWSKIKNHRIDNLLAVCGEGYIVTHHYFPSDSVEEVFINFPDPWPKTKHAKNRIVQPSFIHEIQRILKPNGVITLVTDDQDYSKNMIQVMQSCERFSSIYPSPYYITELSGYGASSSFELLWREKSKDIYYHQFRKR